MSTFTFNGTYITVGPVTGGLAQGGPSTQNRFRLSGSLGAGLALNGFRFSISCPCTRFQDGDYITVRSITLFIASKLHIEYRLCGGECRGELTKWVPGLGLGISGTLRFNFG